MFQIFWKNICLYNQTNALVFFSFFPIFFAVDFSLFSLDMQFMQTLWTDILYELGNARNRSITKVAFLFGISSFWAIVIVVAVLLLILTFIFFIPCHRALCKKIHTAKQELVQQIDEMIYLLAKAQYESAISRQALGGDPHMAMMGEMFRSWHFEYLDNISVIRTNIEKVELLLRKQIVSYEQWDLVTKYQKKLKRLYFRKKIFGFLSSVFTLGIYRLFS